MFGAFYGTHVLEKTKEVIYESFLMLSSLHDLLQTRSRMFGYRLNPGNGAETTLTLTRLTASSVATVILRDSHTYLTEKVGDEDQIRYEMVDESISVPAGDVGQQYTFNVVQGLTVRNESIGQANGTQFQIFNTQNGIVVPRSETVTVDETLSGGIIQTWTRTDNLGLHSGSARVYEWWHDEDGKLFIMFGNGTHGKMPEGYVSIDYRTIIEGQDGNVPANRITVMSPSNSLFSVTNAAAAGDYEDPESDESARFMASRAARNPDDSCCAPESTPNKVENEFSFVGRCATTAGYMGEDTIGVIVTDLDGDGSLTGDQITEVRNFIDDNNPGTERIYAFNSTDQMITIQGDVYLKENVGTTEGQTATQLQVNTYFNPTYADEDSNRTVFPGMLLYPEKIRKVIENTEQVERATLTLPLTVVRILDMHFPKFIFALTYHTS